MIYLASPYSNNPDGNYVRMVNFCTRLLRIIPAPPFFCPVVHYHPIGQGVAYERMMELCIEHLSNCTELWVVKIKDWDKSEGVKREMDFWWRVPLPIVFVNFETMKAEEQ